jgi:hypothetical protein
VDGETKLAYVERVDFEDGAAIRCGALVINAAGVPLEFRATSPVRPTKIQRLTYGKSLDSHVLVEILGRPLLNELRESYSILIVGDPLLLNLRSHINAPCVHLRRQGDISLSATATKLLDSKEDKFLPIVYETFSSQSGDLEAVKPILESASQTIDPMEPFERVRLALQEVHQAKELDQ